MTDFYDDDYDIDDDYDDDDEEDENAEDSEDSGTGKVQRRVEMKIQAENYCKDRLSFPAQ